MPEIKWVPRGLIGGSTWRRSCYPDLWFEQTQFLKSAKNGNFDAMFLQKKVRLCTHNQYLKKRMKKIFVARTQEYHLLFNDDLQYGAACAALVYEYCAPSEQCQKGSSEMFPVSHGIGGDGDGP